MANLVMDGAKKSKGSLAGFHDFGTLWEGGRYLHKTLQIDPREVLGLVKQEAKDDFALTFCALVSHSSSMVYPTVRVPQCYDLERAAAELPVDASRLKVVGHSLAAVASLPRRLANPPPRQARLELYDVLAGRHCSPLSLVDFENYLTYTEHSVENLYFMMWLRAYADEHANVDHSNQTMVTRLSDSVISATRTFVEPDAPYEINLNDASRSGLLAMPASPPPPPSVYDAAQKEVQWLMEDSLRRWEKNAQSNAGWRRLAFSTYVGLANACITVMVMILARIYMHGPSGRILAACLTPWLWFAIVGVVCGLKGVCLLCFSVGGSVRQVSSFELSLPRGPTLATSMPSRSVTSIDSPMSPHSDKTGANVSGKVGYLNDPFSPHRARGPEFMIKPRGNSGATADRKAKIVKFWAPMVPVEDPLIIRAYWETVMKGFLWSLLPATVIGVIAAAV